MNRPRFLDLTICGWTFGLFLFVGYDDNTSTSVLVQVFVWTYVFNSFGYRAWSGIAASCGNTVFNFWGNCQAVFQSSRTISLSRGSSWVGSWKASQGPCFPHPPHLEGYLGLAQRRRDGRGCGWHLPRACGDVSRSSPQPLAIFAVREVWVGPERV